MHEWDGFTNYQRNIGCMRAMFNWKEETKKNEWMGWVRGVDIGKTFLVILHLFIFCLRMLALSRTPAKTSPNHLV